MYVGYSKIKKIIKKVAKHKQTFHCYNYIISVSFNYIGQFLPFKYERKLNFCIK